MWRVTDSFLALILHGLITQGRHGPTDRRSNQGTPTSDVCKHFRTHSSSCCEEESALFAASVSFQGSPKCGHHKCLPIANMASVAVNLIEIPSPSASFRPLSSRPRPKCLSAANSFPHSQIGFRYKQVGIHPAPRRASPRSAIKDTTRRK